MAPLTRRKLLQISVVGALSAALVQACVPVPSRVPATPTSSPTPEPASARIPYGVGFGANELQPQTPAALGLASQAHLGWVRMGLYWQEIEPVPGQYTFDGYDALLAQARANDLNVLAILAYSAQWCTTAPSDPTWNPTHYPPLDLSMWRGYVAAVVERYKGQIHHWEVWNEPDLAQFWSGSPGEYARLLGETYRTIKQVDPTANVVLGGLAFMEQNGQPASTFLSQILADPQYPAADNFDITGVHFYGTPDQATAHLQELTSTLARAGVAGRPVWVTEAGLPSDAALNSSGGVEGQARWLQATLPSLLAAGASRVL